MADHSVIYHETSTPYSIRDSSSVIRPPGNRPRTFTAKLFRIELHRIEAVVSILLVASCEATPAGFALGKLYGNFPVPGRHLLADVCGLAAGVLNVASATGVSSIPLVHMQKVQVEPAVSKISFVVHIAFANDPFSMASEA
jgi:hypothetical protein